MVIISSGHSGLSSVFPANERGARHRLAVVVASVVIMCHGGRKLTAFVAALKSGDEAEALRLLADEGSLAGLKGTLRNNTDAHARALGLDETSTRAIPPPFLSCARTSRDHSLARSAPPRRMARRPSITLQ